MSDTARWAGPGPPQRQQQQGNGQSDGANLADILERVLDKGIVIAGDIQVNLLDIELLTIKIRLVVASVDRAKEMGIDWWERDPTLSAGRRELEDENRDLRQRIEALERGRPELNGKPAETDDLEDDVDDPGDVQDDAHDDEPWDDEPEEAESEDTVPDEPDEPRKPVRRRPARRSPERRDREEVTVPDQLSYVYAVGVRIPHGVLADLRGIGEHPVRPVEAAGLQAVVGSVGAQEFAPGHIETNMQDLDWISATARAHHHVVDAVGAHAVVAPFALATVYLDDDRVAQVLSERHDAFAAVLDRLRGRAEWGLKAWAPSSSPRARTGRAETGAEYLRRRRAVVREAERETGAAYETADVLHATVAGVADAARRHRLHEPALSGRPESMVLNGAYLVDTGRAADWRAAVERAADGSGLAVEITGPWVPYSFAEVEP